MGFSEASLPTLADPGIVPGLDLLYATLCHAQVVLDIPSGHFLKNQSNSKSACQNQFYHKKKKNSGAGFQSLFQTTSWSCPLIVWAA